MNANQLTWYTNTACVGPQANSLRQQRGVTLIELLVALVIGLVVSLAVYSVLNVAEGRKRTTTTVNDIDKAGAFVAYQLNKALSSAGSGFTGGLNPNSGGKVRSAAYSFGCQLSMKKGSDTLLPKSNFSAPFSSITNLKLVPIVIVDGAASRGDVIVSMAGSGGLSESVTNLTSINAAGLRAQTVASLTANDRILLIEANPDGTAKPGGNCLLDQIQTGFTQGDGSNFDVPLAGDYHTGGASTYDGTSTIVLNMGKLPQFDMYGVGNNNTLMKYDLLSPAATGNDANPSAFIEGVYQMEAIYGTTNPSGAVGNFAWQAPTGTYSSAALLAGTPAANSALQTITLVRVAFIMQTNLAEKEAVSSGTVNLFEDVTGLEQTISGLNKNYRYRVIETTIPVRNALVALSP
jgi:type IV pilus assembly protein PilW